MLEPHESDLCRLVAATPDTTLAELQAVLQQRFGVGAGLSTIHNALHRLGLRHKKTLRAAEQKRPNVAHKRQRWHVWQRFMDPARFVSDETGTATDMARRYGRSPSGTRPLAAVPQGHWRTTTFVAGPRQTGIVAPLVLDGLMSGAASRATSRNSWRQHSRPTTSWDNLAAYEVDDVKHALAAAGAWILYLPPYSPGLNPIEQPFAKLKALLRKAAARTRDQLWHAIGRLLPTGPAGECANYLSRCGYGSTQLENTLSPQFHLLDGRDPFG